MLVLSVNRRNKRIEVKGHRFDAEDGHVEHRPQKARRDWKFNLSLPINFSGRHPGKTIATYLDDVGVLHLVSLEEKGGDLERCAAHLTDYLHYYACTRIPVRGARALDSKRVYRRDSSIEGPVHDSWGQLSLQRDPETGALWIVEVRKVWIGAGTTLERFCTRRPWPWVLNEAVASPKSPEEVEGRSSLVDDSLSALADMCGDPWRHEDHDSFATPMLWLTKGSFYHLGAQAFVDVSLSEHDMAVLNVRIARQDGANLGNRNDVRGSPVVKRLDQCPRGQEKDAVDVWSDERCLVVVRGPRHSWSKTATICWYDRALASASESVGRSHWKIGRASLDINDLASASKPQLQEAGNAMIEIYTEHCE